ncbi:MAG: DUF2460 domain-containing protein [Pseudomonadota bacterium]
MSIHDVRFPASISRGASGGPERQTEIVVLGSGHEERNTRWAHSRRRYNAGLGVRTLNQIHEVISFFEARRGRLYGFRWKDHADFKSAGPQDPVTPSDQLIGTGDGTETTFQLKKVYASGGELYERVITWPVQGTLQVAVDGSPMSEGTDYTADYSSGQVIFLPGSVPATGLAVTAGFEFDVPVRFDSDVLEINLAAFEAGEIPDVPIVEVRT